MNIDQEYERMIEGGCLEQGSHLAFQVAQSKGYNLEAWHGTYVDFDEFKKGDIGFHFAKDREVALNRIQDSYCDVERHDFPDGKLLHVAISLHNPIVLKTDLDTWDIEGIVRKAALKLLGIPYQSQQSMYLYEQRQVAQDAWRLLKSIGIDKETAIEWYNGINSPQQAQLKHLYGEILRKRCICNRYDGITYQNDYEAVEEHDPTCYIIFAPNQVKSLEPIYAQDGSLLPLSTRFNKESPKYRI